MANIILFDGVCNLCNRSVQFIIKRDTDGYFKFCSLQSEMGRKLLEQHGLNKDINSFVLIEDEKCHVKSNAALRVCKNLQGVWKLISVFRIIPGPIRDIFYDLVAKNRYQWFGKKESCMLPSAEIKNRFLD